MAGTVSKLRLPKRPDVFHLERRHPLAKGLKFLMAGYNHGAHRAFNSVARGPRGPHGTLVNMDPATDWVLDQELGRWGLDFDGSNDYVALPASLNQSIVAATNIAASCWVKTAVTTTASIFGNYLGVHSPALQLEVNRGATMDQSGRIFAFARRSGGGTLAFYTTTDTGVNDGNWHHLFVLWRLTGPSGEICVDGVAQPVGYSENAVVSLSGMTLPMFIGAHNNNGRPDRLINGSLSDVSLWTHASALNACTTLASRDPMLDGLLVAPGRHVFPAAVATPAFNPVWAMASGTSFGNRVRVIGGGIL